MRIFAILTSIAFALPLLIATDSARRTSQSIDGLLFMSGSTVWLEVSIIVGFWLYKLRPWLKQIATVHPKWVRTVHGDLDVGNVATALILIQLSMIFSVNALVGLNYQPAWLSSYRSMLLRVAAGTTMLCALCCQTMASVPPLLRTTSVSLGCACIYLLLSNSWEGLIVVILPLSVLSETLPVQLQQLVDMLSTLPTHHTAVSPHNGAVHHDDVQQSPRTDTYDANRRLSDVDVAALPQMQRSVSLTAEDYPDFLWLGAISFRKLESTIRYIILAHLAVFLPRTQPLTVHSYNHANLLPANCPPLLQYIGLLLYVCLPVVQLVDFRWQLRQWYHSAVRERW